MRNAHTVERQNLEREVAEERLIEEWQERRL